MERTKENNSELEKMVLCPEFSPNESKVVETVWVKKTTDEIYQLRNSPFYFYGLSLGDKVAAKKRLGRLYFWRVLEKSGNSTYRIFLGEDTSFAEFEKQWTELESLGCTYEQAKERLFAVNVPSGADIDRAYSHLQAAEESGLWQFEEGDYGAITSGS